MVEVLLEFLEISGVGGARGFGAPIFKMYANLKFPPHQIYYCQAKPSQAPAPAQLAGFR